MRAFVLALALAACSKADPTAATTGSAAPAADPRGAVLDAWKAGGLAVTPLAPYTGPAGGDCQTGAVARVNVMLCVFPNAQAAKAAEEAGLAWVGDVTGMAQAHGTVLVAAADRAKADRNGKTINQLMKLAPK